MGRREERSVCTTSFKPGALLITRRGRKVRNKRNTLNIPNIFGLLLSVKLSIMSTVEIITSIASILFHPLFKYVFSPKYSPADITFNNISIVNKIVNT